MILVGGKPLRLSDVPRDDWFSYEIDADRSCSVGLTEDQTAVLLVVINGTRDQRMALTPEAAVALHMALSDLMGCPVSMATDVNQ